MPLLHILYPALKSILVNRLQKILYCSGKFQQFGKSQSFTPSFDNASPCDRGDRSNLSQPNLSADLINETALRRVQDHRQIWYVSAVAFKLKSVTRLEPKSAMALAGDIADALTRDTLSTETTAHPLPLARIWQNFTIQTLAPGWIHLKLNETGLQEWLNYLCDRLPTWEMRQIQPGAADLYPPRAVVAERPTNPFTVLYTHARCCSLLRLGMQEQLIQLEQPDPSLALWALTPPIDITGLDPNRQFRCPHATEQRLIAQIVDVLDALDGTTQRPLPPDKLWQLADRLSQAFQAFYAHCRIFGAVPADDRALAQARLRLVFITQALLHWILQDWLHVSPPIEL